MVSQAKNRSPPPRDGRVIRGRQLKLKAVTEVDEIVCMDLQHGASHRVILETQSHRVIGAVADALALGVLFGEIIGDQTRRVVRRRAGREIAGEDPIAGLDDRQQEIDLRVGLVGGREIVSGPGEELDIRVIRLRSPRQRFGLEERARDMIHAKNLFGGHATTPRPSSAGRASCRNRTTACPGCRPRTPPGACPTRPG